MINALLLSSTTITPTNAAPPAGGWIMNMVYSGFALSVIIFVLFFYTALSNYLRIKQLYKFKKQNVQIYEDKISKWTMIGLELAIIIIFLVEIGLFIAALCLKSGNSGTYDSINIGKNKDGYIWVSTLNVKGKCGIAFDAMFLTEVVITIVYLIFQQLFNSSVILVNKNDTLVTINDYVKRESITAVYTDDRRWFYSITYRDSKNKHNTNKLRLRYSWKLKDFLTNGGYLTPKNYKTAFKDHFDPMEHGNRYQPKNKNKKGAAKND